MHINLLPKKRRFSASVRSFAVIAILLASSVSVTPWSAPLSAPAHADAPSLTLLLNGGTPTLQPGMTNLTYTFSWTVFGASATNVVLTATLPKPLALTTASGTFTSSTTDTATTVTWNLGNQTAPASGSTTVTASVEKSAVNGTSATITGALSSTEVTTPIKIQLIEAVAAPVLSVQAVVTPATAKPGDTVTYTATVTNSGGAQTTNAVLVETLPAGLTFTDGGMTTRSFPLGAIAPAASVTMVYTALVGTTVANGTYADALTVSADNAVAATGSTTLAVQKPVTNAIITVKKKLREAFSNPGDTVHYTITVKNSGNAAAQNLRVSDALPSILTYTDTGSSKRSWTIDELLAGETRTIEYAVRVANNATAGTYTSKVTVKDDATTLAKASSSLDVRVPKVKGVTTSLPSTGVGPGIAFIFFAGSLFILVGALGLYLSRRSNLLPEASDIPRIEFLA